MMLWFQVYEDYSNLLGMTLLEFQIWGISLLSPQRGYITNLTISAETFAYSYLENSQILPLEWQ